MIRFFTWHDIDVTFEKVRSSWPKGWKDVNVYSDQVIIYCDQDEETIKESRRYLKRILTKNYDEQDDRILIDLSQVYLDVFFEEDEDGVKRERGYAPLFKEVYFSTTKIRAKTGKLPGARILAFHSYKGGVGRTLSLISLLRECTARYPDKKILVIDGDVEAPGLTWMLEGQGRSTVSYLDILSVMNFDNDTEDAVKRLADQIRIARITVETDEINGEQLFVPAYRDREQIMNIFSVPERILLSKDDKFYITETLSRLGKAVGAELVLIDLRAGITEYSAPFLFDPRVEKYYVTSTSLQSVKGTNQILEQVYGKTRSELLDSKILLTMIPKTMEEEKRSDIEDQILKNVEDHFDESTEDTFLREGYVIPFIFEDALVHLEDFSSVCRSLRNKNITEVMGHLAEGLFTSEDKEQTGFQEREIREILKKLNNIARNEVTAEGDSSANILITSAIKEITGNFTDELPRIVVGGAKGSGKTYIYKQLLAAGHWEDFKRLVDRGENKEERTLILPLIASLNLKNMRPLIAACISNINEGLGTSAKADIVAENFRRLRECLEQQNGLSRSQWRKKWIEAILAPFGDKFQTLSALDTYLESKGKRILLIVDGLEDLCMDDQLTSSDEWKYIICSICQDIINALDDLDHGNIGIIVFARKDMLSGAIETNYEQFRTLYARYGLDWNQTEALRLALWLAARAYPALSGDMDILNATKGALVEKLTKLWGLKLGKSDSNEAFSDRWIMAALSDFTGQLQARDIVRFLKYATDTYADADIQFKDRLIMPKDVKNAIGPCSRDKIDEIRSEMKHIYMILEKFMEMDEKTLPMTLDRLQLTGDQISRLEDQGFLKISDKKYYLPEIIRLALGFKYKKGARPKVLSLLIR